MDKDTLPNAPAPRAYGIKDFCRAFGISRSTAYNLMSAGQLRSVRVAGRRLIPADSAEALLQDEADSPSVPPFGSR